MNEIPKADIALLAGADRRIANSIIFLTIICSFLVFWSWGAHHAVGFLIGGSLAYLNLRWLISVVDGLLRSPSAITRRRAHFKLILFLFLLTALLCVIFWRAWLPVLSVLGGFSLLVVGVLAECFYQLAIELKR